MKKETKDKKLDEAFAKLRSGDLRDIVKSITDDETIYKAVKKELDKILNTENLSKRLIEDAESALGSLERKGKKFANEIDKHAYWESEYNSLVSDYVSTVEKTIDKFVSSFLEYNMEDEALRFLLSGLSTVSEAENCESESDIKDECISVDDTYKKLIKATGITEEKLDELVNEYYGCYYPDIFSSPDIKIK